MNKLGETVVELLSSLPTKDVRLFIRELSEKDICEVPNNPDEANTIISIVIEFYKLGNTECISFLSLLVEYINRDRLRGGSVALIKLKVTSAYDVASKILVGMMLLAIFLCVRFNNVLLVWISCILCICWYSAKDFLQRGMFMHFDGLE